MIMYQEQYQKILMHLSTEILKTRSLIDVFVSFGVLLENCYYSHLRYTPTSCTSDHHDVEETVKLARDMHRMQKEVCHE